MGPTWGPLGSFRPQMGPMLAHEPCYSGRLQLLLLPHYYHYHYLAMSFGSAAKLSLWLMNCLLWNLSAKKWMGLVLIMGLQYSHLQGGIQMTGHFICNYFKNYPKSRYPNSRWYELYHRRRNYRNMKILFLFVTINCFSVLKFVVVVAWSWIHQSYHRIIS